MVTAGFESCLQFNQLSKFLGVAYSSKSCILFLNELFLSKKNRVLLWSSEKKA